MDGLTLLLFVCGFVALIGGAELMVRGAARLAALVGISPLVVGLTVVAFGTSAPELGVSVLSSVSGQGGIAVGNVVGSNIANVLLILGCSALAAPLLVSQQLLRIEVPLMLGVSLLSWAMALDGTVGRLDGAVLFCGVIVYTVWAIRRSRRDNRQDPGAQEELSERKGGSLPLNLLLIVAGLALLGLGSHWLVSGAVALARHFGVSDLLIGLTIVSIGTSLPELATSVMASLRGQRDIAVGNIVGSNLFNLMAVLGLTAVVAPGGVPVAAQALRFDLPVMVAVMAVCLPVFYTGYRINRWEGGLLAGYYLVYTLCLVLGALGHEALPRWNDILAWQVLPLTVVVLVFSVGRSLYRRRAVNV